MAPGTGAHRAPRRRPPPREAQDPPPLGGEVVCHDLDGRRVAGHTVGARRCRGLATGDRHVRAGKWGKEGLPLARKVTGKRLGILGLGRIGRAIAKLGS